MIHEGKMIVCTVIHVEPNPIVQIKRTESDGYHAIQVGGVVLSKSRANKMTKPLKGHFAKANVPGQWRLKESRVENGDSYQVGQSLDLSLLNEVSHVDVQGVSKGKGISGRNQAAWFCGRAWSAWFGFSPPCGINWTANHAGPLLSQWQARFANGRRCPNCPKFARSGNQGQFIAR